MLKTPILSKIDNCLQSYIESTNSRYKRNFSCVLMSRKNIKKFYYEMKHDLQLQKQNNHKNSDDSFKKKQKNKRTAQVHQKINWQNVARQTVNGYPLITNNNELKGKQKFRRRTTSKLKENFSQNKIKDKTKENEPENSEQQIMIKLDSIFSGDQKYNKMLKSYCFSNITTQTTNFKKNGKFQNEIQDEEINIEDINTFKKLEQQKFINKYKNKKTYQGSMNIKKIQDHQKMTTPEKQEKQNRKLDHCFQKCLKIYTDENTKTWNRQVQNIREEKNRKWANQQQIRIYFFKKHRMHPNF